MKNRERTPPGGLLTGETRYYVHPSPPRYTPPKYFSLCASTDGVPRSHWRPCVVCGKLCCAGRFYEDPSHPFGAVHEDLCISCQDWSARVLQW